MTGGRPPVPPEDRFWPKVNKTETCWLWTGARIRDGYGNMLLATIPGTNGARQKSILAHRFAWELLVGPIPEGMTLDHLCGVKACVRPSHLQVVTNAENVGRAWASRTHCRLGGHPWTEENTILRSDGHRTCRACVRVRQSLRTTRASRQRGWLDQPEGQAAVDHMVRSRGLR